MPGTFVFCDPSGGTNFNAVYYDQFIPANTVGTINGNFSAVLGGLPSAAPVNSVFGNYSTILNGDTNHVNTFSGSNGFFNTIINGQNNTIGEITTPFTAAPACFSSIFGGCQNHIDTVGVTITNHGLIAGGSNNYIGAGADYSAILSGDTNTVNIASQCSFINGGQGNNIGAISGAGAGATWNGIGGGFNNCIDDTAATTSYSGIFGGSNNYVASNNSFVGGGNTNNICIGANCGFIGGGSFNSINSGSGSVIGGGGCCNVFSGIHGNCIVSSFGFIGSGTDNIIQNDSHCSFLGGGACNIIGSGTLIPITGSIFSAIVGGQGNCIDDSTGETPYNIIGGGQTNAIYSGSSFSSIFSGNNQSVAGNNSFIGGGNMNAINLNYSFIGGGSFNCINGCGSVIGGGGCITPTPFAIPDGNSIFSNYGFIGSGACNCINANSDFSVIAGGGFNNITGVGSVIGGGGYRDLFLVSHGNTIYSNYGFIGSGTDNVINMLSDCGVISGGQNNNIGAIGGAGCGSVFGNIGGGQHNTIDDSGTTTSFAVIGGGQGNTICAGSNNSGILSGCNHCLETQFSVIAGGYCSIISPLSANSFIGGGGNNYIGEWLGSGYVCCGAVSSIIVGGFDNWIRGNGAQTDNGVIVGGSSNCIGSGTTSSSIVNGGQNRIDGCYATILGGQLNIIDNTTTFAIIGGGTYNCISVGTDRSSILNGYNNCIASNGSFIGGGQTNAINIISDCSFINSGQCNNIGALGAIGLGSAFSGIGGGQNNCIDDTAAPVLHSGIFGGFGNTVFGSCSSILGGSGNSDGGFNYVGIFGQNVIGVTPNAFHAENYVAQSMPTSPGAPGTFYKTTIGAITVVAIS